MSDALSIVIAGLSLSSSWGNGHATTYRSLIPGLAALGHRVTFLERDVLWYANNRDLPDPGFCELEYYSSVADLKTRHRKLFTAADVVIVGSYVPDGIEVIDLIASVRPKRLCFYDIDTPVTLAQLDEGSCDYLARRQIPRFDAYFSFSGGQVLRRLERTYGARKALALYCSVDPTRHRPTNEPKQWDLGYLGTYSADRQPALRRLLIEPARRLPKQRFVIAGALYPADLRLPANVERIEHLPPEEHASFYSRQRFTLNLTRADMIAAGWSPSVRLFEAAAVGTPIISDTWPGLDEILPSREAVLVADQAEDIVRALTALDARTAKTLGHNARSRVLKHHTGAVRARELVAALRSLSVDRQPELVG